MELQLPGTQVTPDWQALQEAAPGAHPACPAFRVVTGQAAPPQHGEPQISGVAGTAGGDWSPGVDGTGPSEGGCLRR